MRVREQQPLPSWAGAAVIAGTFAGLFVLELRDRLRTRRVEPKAVRTARNLAIAAMAGIVVQTLETPFAMALARRTHRERLGLSWTGAASPAARTAVAVIALDYGLYLWHILTHKVPLLWRFHLVHHVDLDMDASTALRFHLGEMALSIPWRLAQIRIAGASPLALSIWQTGLFASILFHHSNLRLPLRLERVLRFLIVTPRLHGVHHRPDFSCMDSNWSSGLAIWDLLHGTYSWRDDGDAPVGVPGYDRPSDVALARCVTMPFRNQGLPT